MSTRLAFHEELLHHYQGALSVAEAATRRGDHLKAALTLARAEGYMRARSMYFETRKDGHQMAVNTRKEAQRLTDQAELAVALAQGDPNVSVTPRGSYERHHAFVSMGGDDRASTLCNVCTYRADQPIHTVVS